jgi:filamentous hemagglutinin family protein
MRRTTDNSAHTRAHTRPADRARSLAAQLRATVWRGGASLGLAGILTIATGTAIANPTGGTIVSGTVAISQPSGTEVLVQQQSQRAIVNWAGFSIANGETTRFVQPNSQSVILNRVTGTDPSQIAGQLSANGRVFLLNPNGIVVTETGTIDVNSLVATTLPLADGNFLDGRYAFAASAGTSSATVENRGTITVADQGLAALVAPGVTNAGVIRARTGTVALASERAVTVDFSGDGLVSFEVAAAAVDAIVGTSRVDNSGRVEAAGGTILLSAEQAGAILDSAVSGGGTIDASATSGAGGRVRLTSGGASTVTGTVAADGTTAGGQVSVVGGQSVNVGGTVTARGSDLNAAGGTVEITSSGRLFLTGTVLAAPGTGGQSGSLSVDARNIYVGAAAISSPAGYSFVRDTTIQAGIASGTDIALSAADRGTAGAGNIFVGSAIQRTAGTTTGTPVLTLRATNDITLLATVSGSTGLGLGLNLQANTARTGFTDTDPLAGSIFVNAAIDTFGGIFQASGVSFRNLAAIATRGGAFTVAATGAASFTADVDTSSSAGGAITIDATAVQLAANLTSRDAAIAIRAPVILGADTRIVAGNGAVTFAGTVDSNALTASTLPARSLTVTTTGTTTFGGRLGVTNALSGLTVDGGTMVQAGRTIVLPSGVINLLGGTTPVQATVRVANGAVRLGGPVTLGADTRIVAGNGAVTFAGTVDSNEVTASTPIRSLAVATTGTTTFGGRLGVTNALSGLTVDGGTIVEAGNTIVLPSGVINLLGGTTPVQATVRVANGAVRLGGPVTLGADTRIVAGNGAVTFAGTVDSNEVTASTPIRSLAVATTGTTTFGGRLGVTNALSGLTVDGGTIVEAGNTIVLPSGVINLLGGTTPVQATVRVANGAVRLGGPVTLGADTRIVAGNGAVTFAGTVDSNEVTASTPIRSLAVATTGTTTFGGRLGVTNALSGLTVDGGTIVEAGNTIVLPSGVINLLGGTTPVQATVRVANGAVRLGGPVTLGADTRIVAGNGAVTFAGTVDSNEVTASTPIRSLAVATTGTTTFGGRLGVTNALSGLTVDGGTIVEAGNTIVLPSGVINLLGGTTPVQATVRVANGAVRLGGPVTLGADTRIVAGNGAVTFAGTVDSNEVTDTTPARSLTVATMGTTTFAGRVGATNALSGLTTESGTTVLTSRSPTEEPATVRVAGGNVQVGGALTLGANTRIEAGAGAVTFAGTVDSIALTDRTTARSLTVTTAGTTTFAGRVGATGPLQALTTDGAGLLAFANGVSTIAAQTYNESVLHLAGTFESQTGGFTATAPTVTLTGNTVIRSGGAVATDTGAYDIVLNGIASAQGANPALTLDTPDTVRLKRSVAIGSLTVASRGTTLFKGEKMDVGSSLTIANPLRLGSNTTITAGGAVDLGGTIGGVAGIAAPSLIVTATGQTRLGGEVALRSLTLSGTGSTRIDTGSITVDDAVSFAADVLLGSNTTLTATRGGIHFAGSVGGLGHALTLSAGTTVQADKDLSLAALTVSKAERFRFKGSAITTTGDLRTVARLDFTASPTLASSLGGIDLAGDVSGSGALTVNAATTGRFGGSVDVGSLQTGGQGSFQLDGAAVTAVNTVRFSNPVTVGRDMVIAATAPAGTVTFGATVNGTAALLVRSAGTTRFTGPVTLGALETDAGGTTVLGTGPIASGTAITVTARSSLRFGDAVTLEQNTGVRADSVEFRDAVTSAAGRQAALTVEATGTARFQGDVGGGNDNAAGATFGAGALRRLDVTAGGIAFAAPSAGTLLVRTVGGAAENGQRYAGPVTIEGGRVIFDTTNVRDRWEFARGGTLRFDAMTGAASAVDLRVGSASVLPATEGGAQPNVVLNALSIYGTGGRIELTGTIRGVSGPAAAQLVFKSLPRSNSFRFNGCAMGSPTCVVAGLADLPSPEGLRLRVERPGGELDNFIAPVVDRGNEDLWIKPANSENSNYNRTDKQ